MQNEHPEHTYTVDGLINGEGTYIRVGLDELMSGGLKTGEGL